jgi:hypothetical protein
LEVDVYAREAVHTLGGIRTKFSRANVVVTVASRLVGTCCRYIVDKNHAKQVLRPGLGDREVHVRSAMLDDPNRRSVVHFFVVDGLKHNIRNAIVGGRFTWHSGWKR